MANGTCTTSFASHARYTVHSKESIQDVNAVKPPGQNTRNHYSFEP